VAICKGAEMISGNHLIDGQWVGSDTKFSSDPIEGPIYQFSEGNPVLVDKACRAAEEAFPSYSARTRQDRAAFLEKIAVEIEAVGPEITVIGSAETGLPPQRLESERSRTVGQLRAFAEHIRKTDYLDLRHDPALPDRLPYGRPDIRMIQMPIGPIAVFGASNFPLAFSVAGGDTASALAAGCPVVVKGHSAHPGTGEIVAQAVHKAVLACDMPKGVFSLVQGGSREVGQALVTHPAIQAVGFTGSLVGGRALFDLCAARSVPIPFFGELGSVNPVFVLQEAMRVGWKQIAHDWSQSLTAGVGQFCTNPGILVVQDCPELADFEREITEVMTGIPPQPMLTVGIARAYHEGIARFAGETGVRLLTASLHKDRSAVPALYSVKASDWQESSLLAEEVFGPVGLVVVARDEAEVLSVAARLKGQLTCTLHSSPDDSQLASQLMPVLSRKAGRIVVNGFPTGVEVCDAMVHGGPYPASTNFGASSVGTVAIRRWLRPVAFQNCPIELLPLDLCS
jgi:2,5-dioxopentanoate dehydrogenase